MIKVSKDHCLEIINKFEPCSENQKQGVLGIDGECISSLSHAALVVLKQNQDILTLNPSVFLPGQSLSLHLLHKEQSGWSTVHSSLCVVIHKSDLFCYKQSALLYIIYLAFNVFTSECECVGVYFSTKRFENKNTFMTIIFKPSNRDPLCSKIKTTL